MKWHLALSALINTKQTRPGVSMTEKIALVIDVPGRVCYLLERAYSKGECYIIHPRNLVVKDNIICIPAYMTFCL